MLYSNQAATITAGLWPVPVAGEPLHPLFCLADFSAGSSSGKQGGMQEGAPQLAGEGAPFSLTWLKEPERPPLGAGLQGGGDAVAAGSVGAFPLTPFDRRRSSAGWAAAGGDGSVSLRGISSARSASLPGQGNLDSVLAALPAGNAFQTTGAVAPHAVAVLCQQGMPHASPFSSAAGAAASCGTGSDAGGVQPCWFVTLHHPANLTPDGLQCAQLACSPGVGGSSQHFLRPEVLREVQLGPLLGTGAFVRQVHCAPIAPCRAGWGWGCWGAEVAAAVL